MIAHSPRQNQMPVDTNEKQKSYPPCSALPRTKNPLTTYDRLRPH